MEQVQRSDAELLATVVQGVDRTALDELINRHAPMVFRTGYRILHDIQEAEDSAQATFLIMIRKLNSLKSEFNLGAWLHGVARHTALHALRARTRRKIKEQQSMKNFSIQSHGETNDLREILHQSLDRELEKLTGNQRQAVLLCYLQGYSQKEAAAIAGCSIDAINRRANFGLTMLRKRLGKISPALGISIIPLLDSEAKAQVSPTLLSSIKSAVLSAKAGTLAGSGTTAYLMAKGVLEMMFWNKVKLVAVSTIVVLAIPSTVIVVQKINAREKPPASAEKIVNSIPQPAKNPEVSQSEQIPKESKKHLAVKTRDYDAEIKKRLLEIGPENEYKLRGCILTVRDSAILRNILRELFDEDQSSLIEWARKSREDQTLGVRMLPLMVEIWAEKDPKAAIEWIATQDQGVGLLITQYERSSLPQSLAQGWAKKDPAAVIEWIRTRPESEQGGLYEGALVGWVTKDPEAALEWAGQNPKLISQDALVSVIMEYSNKNPEEAARLALQLSTDNKAFDYLSKIPDGQMVVGGPTGLAVRLGMTLGLIANNWAMKDPKAAAQWAMQLPEGDIREMALVAAAKNWYLTEPDAAVQWILQLPNRDNALSAIATASAFNNPDADAALKLAMEIPEGTLRDNTLVDVANSWGRKDPTAAAEWARQLPEGQLKDRVLLQVVGSLACEDPDAAENLARQVSGEGKDEVLSRMAESLAFKDPERAAKLAMEMSDDKQQDFNGKKSQMLIHVACAWNSKDSAKANEWVQNLKISDSMRKMILQWMESRKNEAAKKQK